MTFHLKSALFIAAIALAVVAVFAITNDWFGFGERSRANRNAEIQQQFDQQRQAIDALRRAKGFN